MFSLHIYQIKKQIEKYLRFMLGLNDPIIKTNTPFNNGRKWNEFEFILTTDSGNAGSNTTAEM